MQHGTGEQILQVANIGHLMAQYHKEKKTTKKVHQKSNGTFLFLFGSSSEEKQ